jgi:uncharacterized integral membrane protein
MIRLALAVIATIVIVVFCFSNSHHVELSCGVGRSIQLRLIFLLLTTFILGMAVPVFFRLIRRLDSERNLRREMELRQAAERVDEDIVG